VFKLRALIPQESGLRACGIELRLLLGDVEPRGDPTRVPVIDKIESFSLVLHRGINNRNFSVEFAQVEVVGG